MDLLKMHIYIVDDDQSFGRSLKRLLNARGMSADYFPSARAFLNSLPVDLANSLAIVDIHMPDCNGFSLMDKLQDSGCCIPLIVITGQTQADAMEQAMARGAIGFLRKPFNEEPLLELIRNHAKQENIRRSGSQPL